MPCLSLHHTDRYGHEEPTSSAACSTCTVLAIRYTLSPHVTPRICFRQGWHHGARYPLLLQGGHKTPTVVVPLLGGTHSPLRLAPRPIPPLHKKTCDRTSACGARAKNL